MNFRDITTVVDLYLKLVSFVLASNYYRQKVWSEGIRIVNSRWDSKNRGP